MVKGAALRCSINDLQQSALIHPSRVEVGSLQNEAESIRDVSDSEAGVEGGAATFKTHNNTTEIALQLEDGCLQHARSGTSEVVSQSSCRKRRHKRGQERVEGWIQVVKNRTLIRRSSSHEVNRFTEECNRNAREAQR